jgi:hypothetical protein
LTLAALVAPARASALVFPSPFGNAPVLRIAVKLLDPVSFVLTSAVLTYRLSDFTCVVTTIPSDGNGRITFSSEINGGSGDDTLMFWNDPNWTGITCGGTSAFIQAFDNPFSFRIAHLNGQGGRDRLFGSSTAYVFLHGGPGDDLLVPDLATTTIAMGDEGNDTFFPTGMNKNEGGDGDDVFCLRAPGNTTGRVDGDRGTDTACGGIITANTTGVEIWRCDQRCSGSTPTPL